MRLERSRASRGVLTMRACALTCALTLALGASSLAAQPAPARVDEGAVKAAFIFNFAAFVQWPAKATGPIRICVAAEDTFTEQVTRKVRGNLVDNREVTTQPLRETDDPNPCDLVFVASTRQKHNAEMLQRINTPTLTIGETVQFMREGGMVRLFIENNRLRFQINQKAADAAGIKLSSRLLALSR